MLWLQALRGQPNSRFAGSANPTRSLATQSIVAGAIALVLGLLSFVLMSHHYKDWDAVAKAVKTAGSTLQKNPQPGLYAVLLGGVLLIAVRNRRAGHAGYRRPQPGTAPARRSGAPAPAPATAYGAAPGYYPAGRTRRQS